MPRLNLLLLLTLSLTLNGCGGSSDLPELGEVTGTVTLDDTPVPGAEVRFSPEGEGNESFGYTNEDGKYVLKYGGGRNLGAVVGAHKVSVTAGEGMSTEEDESGGTTSEASPEVVEIPEKFNGQNTTLRKEVEAGSQTIDLKLTSDGGEG